MLRRILLTLAGMVIVLALVGVVFGIFTVRRSFPQIDGQIQVDGLQGPVDIYRDPYGVPHIYASTAHDLFFAQGYAACPGPLLADGFLAPHRLGAPLRDVRRIRSWIPTSSCAPWAGRESPSRRWINSHLRARRICRPTPTGVNAYLADHQAQRSAWNMLF